MAIRSPCSKNSRAARAPFTSRNIRKKRSTAISIKKFSGCARPAPAQNGTSSKWEAHWVMVLRCQRKPRLCRLVRGWSALRIGAGPWQSRLEARHSRYPWRARGGEGGRGDFLCEPKRFGKIQRLHCLQRFSRTPRERKRCERRQNHD